MSATTQRILLESAHFAPGAIAGRARQYGLHTDASHRFERGVDPMLPPLALARAWHCLQTIYPHATLQQTFTSAPSAVAQSAPILLRHTRVERLLGQQIAASRIVNILQNLGMVVLPAAEMTWQVTPPRYRFDIAREVDLIEEIIRIAGYDQIPAKPLLPLGYAPPLSETQLTLTRIKQLLVDQGFREIVTYSFVDPQWQQACDPDCAPLHLANPLAITLSAMRTNLWPGLLQTVQYNLHRQQSDLRLFETGLCFRPATSPDTALQQQAVLSGALAGNALVEQWSSSSRPVDFFDARQVVTQIWQLTHQMVELQWQADAHPALHPGQSARIYHCGKPIGWCGVLHPQLQQRFDIAVPVVLFELQLVNGLSGELPVCREISKYPAIRRDIALLLDRHVTAQQVCAVLQSSDKVPLTDVRIFDIYEGKNIPPDKKSMAVACTFQAGDRTLTEEEIQQALAYLLAQLGSACGARLRE